MIEKNWLEIVFSNFEELLIQLIMYFLDIWHLEKHIDVFFPSIYSYLLFIIIYFL